MKHYQLTSDSFIGAVDFYFNDLGLLESHSIKEAELSEKQQIWLLRHLPREIQELTDLNKDNPQLKVTEIKEEVTFLMFWNRYDEKLLSSKKKTEAKWNKMTKTNQLKAYQFVPTYFNNIPAGTRKKYAEMYLNAEMWNN